MKAKIHINIELRNKMEKRDEPIFFERPSVIPNTFYRGKSKKKGSR